VRPGITGCAAWIVFSARRIIGGAARHRHPGQKERVLGHVLGDFVKDDREWLLPVLDAVADAAPLLVQGKPEDFMTKVALLSRDSH
jgi:peptidyl-tRNA hydrolase